MQTNINEPMEWRMWSQFSKIWRSGGPLTTMRDECVLRLVNNFRNDENPVVVNSDIKGISCIPFTTHWLNHPGNLVCIYKSVYIYFTAVALSTLL